MIHCIGDSHTSIFNGTNNINMGGEFPSTKDTIPGIRSYNIGPAIAYSLIKPGHRWDRGIMSILNRIPKNDAVLLSFGQIDCANHLPKQKILQPDRPYESIITECADRYFQYVKRVRDMGFRAVIVYGPVVPTKGEVIQYNYDDKIKAVKLFTDHMVELCKNELNIFNFTVYDKLLNENNETLSQYYRETIHLNTNFLPIVLKEIEKFI